MITLGVFNAVTGIRHAYFTRAGGVSDGIYASKNCSFGSADARDNVTRNRARCMAELDAPGPALVTAYQAHSADVVAVETPWQPEHAPQADAMVTQRPGIALGILTADCAPVLFCDPDAGVIGAAHAGWKGARDGVIEATVAAMRALGAEPGRIIVGVGPRIGQRSYEVGAEFRDRFMADDPDSAFLFVPARRDGHHMFDLAGYIDRRLRPLGIEQICITPNDTVTEETRFFSYRRSRLRGEPDYGRCLSAILIES